MGRVDLLHEPQPFMVTQHAFDHKPKGAEGGFWSRDFYNRLVTPFELVSLITAGHSYCAWHEDNQRDKEHWVSCSYVSIDLEKHPEAALDCIEMNQFFAAYGFLSYTTLSHTEQEPRGRALFVLDKPCTNVNLWHYGAKAVMGMFRHGVDPSSVDVSRGFLGNPYAMLRMYGKFLPSDVLYVLATQQRKIEAQQRQHGQARPVVPLTGQAREYADQKALEKWLDEVRMAPEGERNHRLNRAAFLMGRHLVAKGVMGEQEAMQYLEGAGMAAGLEQSEILKTVTQALRKGARA